jgi:electron-transferring-flavoprotein dehydrogenase
VTREAVEADVVIVGAGPAGLSAAIRIKQLGRLAGLDPSVLVVEKASQVGAHIVSGAIIDPCALQALFPDWRSLGAPLTIPVRNEAFRYLTSRHALTIPGVLLPRPMHNEGNFVVSLGTLCQWLAAQAGELGAEIFPGFAATELLLDERGNVAGIVTGDMGLDRDSRAKPGHAPGMELRARYTLLAEGARGSLARQAVRRFGLDRGSDPQKYGLGIKEIWKVAPDKWRPGEVQHTLGWPLDNRTGGGGFIYHGADQTVSVGFVAHLNYENPYLSPFEDMQRFKTHPHISPLLEGGERLAYGARAMTSGGWQSIPQLAFPGGALVGCSAGFMNLPRIKGTHNAMWSGMAAAEAVFPALEAGRAHDLLDDLDQAVRSGPIRDDLWPVRNVKPLLAMLGTPLATLAGGIDMWIGTLLGASPTGHAATPQAGSCSPAPRQPVQAHQLPQARWQADI